MNRTVWREKYRETRNQNVDKFVEEGQIVRADTIYALRHRKTQFCIIYDIIIRKWNHFAELNVVIILGVIESHRLIVCISCPVNKGLLVSPRS